VRLVAAVTVRNACVCKQYEHQHSNAMQHVLQTWLTCRPKVTNVALAACAVRYTVGLARAVAVCNAQMGLTCRAKVSTIALAACAGGRAMSLTAAVTVLDARVYKTLALALKARHLQTWLTC
jgi:hypothetical protein